MPDLTVVVAERLKNGEDVNEVLSYLTLLLAIEIERVKTRLDHLEDSVDVHEV